MPSSTDPSTSNSTSKQESGASDVISFVDTPIKMDFDTILPGERQEDEDSSSHQPKSHPRHSTAKKSNVPLSSLEDETSASKSLSRLAQKRASSETYYPNSASKSESMDDVIHIKDEVETDEEQDDQTGSFSAYGDYSGLAYGGSSQDGTQMYGESSGFNPDALYDSNEASGGVDPRTDSVSFLFILHLFIDYASRVQEMMNMH